jgi:hypothetical protein
VVKKMVDAVLGYDPDFSRLLEEPIPLEETPEYRWMTALTDGDGGRASAEFIDEFDASMGGRISRLIDYSPHAEETMAQAVRTVLGLPRSRMSDGQAIGLVLHPAHDSHLAEMLNVTTLGKLTRTMVHPHFTFRKRLSHTADSQDQRHRMTPASRPILSRQFFPDRPDYVVPLLIRETPEALEVYTEAMKETWAAMDRMAGSGVPDEFVLYLIPNAFPIRFEESGDLLNLHHKWTKRLCYTAQEEIWTSCREEVLQVAQVCPGIASHLFAPCTLRKMAGVTPFCPEGDRYCGVPVWNLPLSQYQRLL